MEESIPDTQDVLKNFRDMWKQQEEEEKEKRIKNLKILNKMLKKKYGKGTVVHVNYGEPD